MPKGILEAKNPELVRDNLYAIWDNYCLREEPLIGLKTPAERHPREFNSRTRCLCEEDRVATEIASSLTVRLTSEHRAITRDLGRLRAATRKLESGDRFSEALLFTKLAESLNEHFRREEQLLFPLLSRSLSSGICDRLKNEHEEILSIAKKLSVQSRPLEELFSHLKQLFRAHISTEENVLFWYLDLQQPTE
jgi:hemerythrin-like domain-containing protein